MTKPQMRFAVFDIDGTLIRWQLYHAITHELGVQGHLLEGSLERLHASRMEWKNRNSIDAYHHYENDMVSVFQDALAGMSVDAYQAAVDTVFDTYKEQVYTYTRDLVARLKREGYLLFAISGSPQQALDKIGELYGFDEVIGAQYEQKNGAFTGNIELAHVRKGEILQELVTIHNATWQGSVAVGDSPSDVAMLELVEQPIAFNPTDDLYKLAMSKQWPIVVERKNVIYELAYTNGSYRLKDAHSG